MPSHSSNSTIKSSKNPLVSTMIKQGFIYDPLLSPTPSPPPSHNLPLCLYGATLASNYLSPPPSYTVSPPTPAAMSSPSSTLFEMMSDEHARESKQSIQARNKHQDRIFKVLAEPLFEIIMLINNVNNLGYGDVRLTVAARGGFRVSMEIHRRVLAGQSRFFAEKLRLNGTQMVSVEILECDDVEAYVEAVVFMYSDDLKKKLMGEEVSKVLELLKVSCHTGGMFSHSF